MRHFLHPNIRSIDLREIEFLSINPLEEYIFEGSFVSIYLKKIFNPIIARSRRYFLKYRTRDVQLILKTRDFATRIELPGGMYNRFGKKKLESRRRRGTGGKKLTTKIK